MVVMLACREKVVKIDRVGLAMIIEINKKMRNEDERKRKNVYK